MDTTGPTRREDALTELILTLFRVNNLTLAWGDRLVAALGLTSARWQILGAIVAADRPQPVAWLARDLGANRQNVQRIVNDLHKDEQTYDAAIRLYAPKVNALADGLPVEDIETAQRLLTTLRKKLEGN